MRTPIFEYVLVKVASRCNINCTYCYWFRDQSVYAQPKVMGRSVQDKLLERIENQIRKYGLKRFAVLLHGGEPLLWGIIHFRYFCGKCREIEQKLDVKFDISMTTNATLIDDVWVGLIVEFGVFVTISLDGDEQSHNRNRVDFQGRGTYRKVVNALALLSSSGVKFGVLGVAQPDKDSRVVVKHLVGELGICHFDLLIPDATHDDVKPISIANYYMSLFDIWYDELATKGVQVRLMRGLAVGILGGEPHLESIGYGPIQTCVIMPDGTMEPLDVLRIAGEGSTKTNLDIFSDEFQAITSNEVWLTAFNAALNLPDKCNACSYRSACGGGYLPHRYSKVNGYDNPTVYCDDMIRIFDHVWQRMKHDIYLEAGDRKIPASLLSSDELLISTH